MVCFCFVFLQLYWKLMFVQIGVWKMKSYLVAWPKQQQQQKSSKRNRRVRKMLLNRMTETSNYIRVQTIIPLCPLKIELVIGCHACNQWLKMVKNRTVPEKSIGMVILFLRDDCLQNLYDDKYNTCWVRVLLNEQGLGYDKLSFISFPFLFWPTVWI